MIRVFIVLCFMTFGQVVASASGQQFDKATFEEFVKTTMTASNVPGAAVIVWDDEETLFADAFGRADEKGSVVTLETPFQVGSVSKTFAAVLMVQLAAEGRLALDAPVVDYLPNFRTQNAETSRNITIKHILSHRSGFATIDGNRIQHENDRSPDALTTAVEDLGQAQLVSVPGERYEYSNANYMIAAAVIESVTGQSYEKAMHERVFLPLGMTNSYVQLPTGTHVQEAMGFRQWFTRPVAFSNIAGRAYVAAGGVTASARDLATYVRAVANADPRIIPQDFSDTMFLRQDKDGSELGGWYYGLGWMIADVNGEKVIYHSGLNGGFSAQAAFSPTDGRGALALTNQSGMIQADVPGVIVRKALGAPTGPVDPSLGQHLTVWGLALTALSLSFFYVLSTLRFAAFVKRTGKVGVLRRVLPAIGLFALAYGLVFIVPRMNDINLSGIKVFYPDVWLCLVLSAAVAFLWGVTRLLYPRPDK